MTAAKNRNALRLPLASSREIDATIATMAKARTARILARFDREIADAKSRGLPITAQRIEAERAEYVRDGG